MHARSGLSWAAISRFLSLLLTHNAWSILCSLTHAREPILENGTDRPKRHDRRTDEPKGSSTLPDKMLPRLLGPMLPAQKCEHLFAIPLRRTSPHAAIARCDRNARSTGPDQHELTGLHCPTLVIAGSGDAIIPVEDCERMAAAIPGARFHLHHATRDT